MPRRPNLSPQTARLLETLLAEPDAWRHGYELSKATGLKSGTLYPLLMRLHDGGSLEAEWREPEKPGRPARRVYRLTASGRRLAIERAADARKASRDSASAPRPFTKVEESQA